MITRMNKKHIIDVYDLLERCNDRFSDFYITEKKDRKFIKKNWDLIRKILKTQECYGVFKNGLKGVIILYRTKGFRPYLKIMTEGISYTIDLLKFLKWNFLETQLYCKLKKESFYCKQLLKCGFIPTGDRGAEILFEKKAIKDVRKIVAKDDYLGERNHANNYR